MMRKYITLVLITILFVVWWWWIAEWLDKPGTYRLVIAYLIVGVLVWPLHLYATWRFNRMVHNVRADERLGLADPGSTTFAANQRFRYIARSIEAAMIIAVSILGIIALGNTGLRQSHQYIRLVVTYLIGSVLLTGFLTLRDLHVINAVRRAAEEDAAALRPILRYKSGQQHEEEMGDGSKH